MIRRVLLVLLAASFLVGCSSIPIGRFISDIRSNLVDETPTVPMIIPQTEDQVSPPATEEVSPETTDGALQRLTPLASPTETTVPPTATSTQEPSPTPQPARFSLQPGAPAYVGNFLLPDQGCNWMGVAGQVFGVNGQPLEEVVVEVSGEIQGEPVIFLAVTGAEEGIGPGGYAIGLGETPVDTEGDLAIRLFGLEGQPLSEIIPINTYSDCTKTLAIVNFIEKLDVSRHYLPLLQSAATPTPE